MWAETAEKNRTNKLTGGRHCIIIALSNLKESEVVLYESEQNRDCKCIQYRYLGLEEFITGIAV